MEDKYFYIDFKPGNEPLKKSRGQMTLDDKYREILKERFECEIKIITDEDKRK